MREKTGVGSSVKVSLFDGAADWMSVPILHQKYTGKGPERVGLRHPSIAPYGHYSSGDGKAVVISIQNNREWKRFCSEVLERPELTVNERFCSNNQRVINRDKLDVLISDRFRHFSSEELRKKLYDSGIAFGSVNHTEDLVNHPQLRYAFVDTPSGPAQIVAPPVILNSESPKFGAVPALGEHTERVLAEFSNDKMGAAL
jgi:crotonobetainyl-CoA:carnitine CoA-transferase CaiB-like acyl-CoA transferase